MNNDSVNHPAHYSPSSIEVIDAIEAWELGFHLGNTVKYIARSGKKDPAKTIEDLQKAVWYLNRKIDRMIADRIGAAAVDHAPLIGGAYARENKS
jgi:hypothetical protein